ncbi:MAG: hypothetical protein ACRC42_03200 [Mycoplasma sp.]
MKKKPAQKQLVKVQKQLVNSKLEVDSLIEKNKEVVLAKWVMHNHFDEYEQIQVKVKFSWIWFAIGLICFIVPGLIYLGYYAWRVSKQRNGVDNLDNVKDHKVVVTREGNPNSPSWNLGLSEEKNSFTYINKNSTVDLKGRNDIAITIRRNDSFVFYKKGKIVNPDLNLPSNVESFEIKFKNIIKIWRSKSGIHFDYFSEENKGPETLILENHLILFSRVSFGVMEKLGSKICEKSTFFNELDKA